jgi:hypothetical protein
MLYRLLGVLVWRFGMRYLRRRSRRAASLPRLAAGALVAVLATGGAAFARSRRAGS